MRIANSHVTDAARREVQRDIDARVLSAYMQGEPKAFVQATHRPAKASKGPLAAILTADRAERPICARTRVLGPLTLSDYLAIETTSHGACS
jgi:hypothetical protein